MENLPKNESLETRTKRKITKRLMPFLILLFIMAYIDRVNVGYANLGGMSKELGFNPEIIGFGAGIFFIGYFLLEIPGTLIVENWSARKWLARIIISWGILAVLTGFIQNTTHFYVIRFLLGLAEAGFFPGIIVYLSHWFRYQDRAKAVAMFMTALPFANIFGSPISGFILGINWFGLSGWRWVFILEGIPAVILGIVTIYYLTDKPSQADWLEEEEKEWITAELEREKQAKKAVKHYTILEAFQHRNVIILAAAYFCAVTAVYGFTFWLPEIIKRISGFSDQTVSLLGALPYCAGLVGMLIIGWSSDRRNERRRHTSFALITAGTGLFLSAVTSDFAFLAILMFCLAAVGLYSYLPSFWALPTAFLTESAAAASIGLINSVGNLGGFVGSYIPGYLTNKTGSHFSGVIYLSCSALVAAILILFVRHSPAAEEKR
jgi:ACS family tartrate transporter-like MFS transporter